ncbi:glutamine--fructose-6-phosphate transaminase (isomerizing) [Zongyangia hominis]|uniref:Glutamine--fructose-6-phosphate aminotransferase [isomerizing] n=1 Tax=Zongyangia hominis TaxID=2763677 RepID=A0A926I7I2_9FIRM|nr:glutamine--fructose-6-phosphate transaminase (isomerizing) [Zongyangia hominis]MBC8571139.1 glutamine--fructose-6-phosphate transaminase (isomerizing) [Zongyangia hominis]
MCGIVGYIGSQNASDILIDGLKKLEYRGYDSAGVAVFAGNDIEVVKSKGRLADLEKKMEEVGKPQGFCGIGHTRWATHGEPSDINSHPHSSAHVSLVHNGIIENYLPLRQMLQGDGYVFQSETDTEVVVNLIDSFYHGDPLEAIREAVLRLEGSYALGIIFEGETDKVYAVRKDSPLIIGLGKGENFIASDIPAILGHTRDYYLLEEGEIAVLTRDHVEISDIYGNHVEKEVQTATWDLEAAQKGGYPHFMLKEIHEQPTAFHNTVSPRIVDGLPNFACDKICDEDLRRFERVVVVACGTAMHSGYVGQYLIERLARLPVTVEIASEFRYKNPILNRDKDLVIIVSQSGETADTLAALRLAKKQGVFVLGIVNVVGSSIAREADAVIYTWAGPEIAVASTKAYTVQISVMYLLAIKFAMLRGFADEAFAREYTSNLMSVEEHIAEILKDSQSFQFYASKLQNAHDLFYLGRGLDYALAMEGSLKLKEITYIHSEAYAAGELKHGPISLIVDGTPVIALGTQKSLFEKMASNIKEVKSRGACVFLICDDTCENTAQIADFVIKLPALPEIFMPLLSVAPLQLLAYYTSILRGCDVDKPRNLAKSVTVE